MRIIKRILIFFAACLVTGAAAAAGINWYVCSQASPFILSRKEAGKLEKADCILVLGCSVKKDHTPSVMLEDRLETAIALYRDGVSDRILMIGDHGQDDYNEVQVMKDVAMAAGVEEEKIFMDHAGFSTYDSMYRARDVFSAEKIVIVTQKYHLYRAVYIARSLGLDAYGVPAEEVCYAGQWMRDLREIAARVKDWAKLLTGMKASCLGETIPVSGNGTMTNDRK